MKPTRTGRSDEGRSDEGRSHDDDRPKDDPGDGTTTVDDLKGLVERFVAEREWHVFHNPKNLAMSLAIETAELMEHFQWLTPEQAEQAVREPSPRAEIGEEMADCLAYLLSLANVMKLDLSSALREKMLKNAVKYPVATSRGVARPGDPDPRRDGKCPPLPRTPRPDEVSGS